ncbi:Rieske (2Fe-2S) protein [Xanthobacter sp. KR7-65]|uniref:Rieske (2Fe-2S) protein n=1 Tax=Xanthobacter sp. KR7-65 TaxID=3156612 RepID=UPI0032B37E31
MAPYVIARIRDFDAMDRVIASVAGRSIGVFKVGGAFFAVRNQCPHAGGPLCLGDRGGIARSSEPGTFDYSRRGEFLRCPWHSWEFDLRTGKSWFDPERVRVRAYETAVLDGDAVLACEAKVSDGAASEAEGREPGPYQVETYPVSVHDDYVVVEI